MSKVVTNHWLIVKKVFKNSVFGFYLGLGIIFATLTSIFVYQGLKNPLNRETSLNEVVRTDSAKLIKLWLENGTKIDTVDHFGRTPLHIAAEYNADAAAQILIENGASLETKDNNGFSPIQTAIQNNAIDVINTFIEKGADVTVNNPYGYSLLHLAAALGNLKVIELLMSRTPILIQEKYFKDAYGCTPLHMAQRRGFRHIVQLLMPYHVLLEDQKSKKLLPFDKIATGNHLEFLIRSGQMTTFIEWARESHKESMLAKVFAMTPTISQFSTVELPTGEYLKWPPGVAELHQLGLTGKDVFIGVIDFDLDHESGHGPTVENIIQAIAPAVKIIRKEANPPVYYPITDQDGRKKPKAIPLKWILHLRSKVDQTILCHPYNQGPFQSKHQKETQKIAVKSGERMTLYHGTIRNLVNIQGTFCYIDTHKNDFTQWELIEKSSHIQNNTDIRDLMRQGALIINYSKGIDGLLWSQKTIKEFNDLGGILVKSAGNYPYIPGAIPTTKLQFPIDALDLIQDRWIEKSNFVIVVGALEKDSDGNVSLAPYSTRAGSWKNKYITTLVDLRKHCQILTGTSYAAPQITGILALLKEAFPHCHPQDLARILLDTAQPIARSTKEETGKGEIDPLRAYKMLQQDSINLCKTKSS